VISRFAGKREPYWYPYTPQRRNLLRRASNLVNARGLRRFRR
jgi:hypothetical protein